jgi:hypothetical protein
MIGGDFDCFPDKDQPPLQHFIGDSG